MAPQRGLIAAQPVEGIGRQIAEANKGAREISPLICILRANWCARIESTDGLVVILPNVPFRGEAVVVGIGRGAPADEARLGGHKP